MTTRKVSNEKGTRMKIVIEALKGSNIRVRLDELTLERLATKKLNAAYPYYYGFAYGTKSGGQDALDCFIISDSRYKTGDIAECRVVDGFIFYEGDEEDLKLICSDHDNLDTHAIKQNIESFLRSVFSAWPEIDIKFGDYLGLKKIQDIISDRQESAGSNPDLCE